MKILELNNKNTNLVFNDTLKIPLIQPKQAKIINYLKSLNPITTNISNLPLINPSSFYLLPPNSLSILNPN